MAQSFIKEDTLTQLQEPIMASVIILNDDYTPMDFVVDILINIFDKTHNEATKIMLDVHHKGSGVCGIYPYDIAELKIDIAHQKAKSSNFPLQFELKIL